MSIQQEIRLECPKHGLVKVKLETNQKVATCKHCIGEAFSRYVTEGGLGGYKVTSTSVK